MKTYPFDNFKTAITNPAYFFGREEIIKEIHESPFLVYILLGGRRIGKTSTLRALEWNLLDNTNQSTRAFPVFLSLQVEQPKSLDNFRYILIAKLREAIERWRNIPGKDLREKYRSFLRQIPSGELAVNFLSTINTKININNPDYERKLIHDDFRQALLKTIEELNKFKFEGVCFLLDETDFVVKQDWANDAWSYFRGLKDNDTAIKSFFGLVLSGYRDLKNYQQTAGSPLYNISQILWLQTINENAITNLVSHRCREENIHLYLEITMIKELAGCHPYLTQQMLNLMFDKQPATNWKRLVYQLNRQHDGDFERWWNDGQPDGFSDGERAVYKALINLRQGSAETLSSMVNLSYNKTAEALELLAGTGVIQQLDDEENYRIGAKLFEEWVNGF